MKTQETTEITVLQQVGENLLQAQQEIDELALQLSLGRGEGKDEFEEVKREFRRQVSQLKKLLANQTDKSISPEITAMLDELELQLAPGNADSTEKFDSQKYKILRAIKMVEAELKDQWHKIQSPHFFVHEIEKFKLKLEILRLRFGLKKFEVKEGYHAAMALARTEISDLTAGAKEQINNGKEKYDDFRDEVSLAYRHLRKAVESLS